jgi:hypothetical protein
MLEYMLLRPIERQIFADTRTFFETHPDEKFYLILDEAHLYRGANGTEVAYLVRRMLDRLGLPSSRVAFIATSASFSNAEAAKDFVSRLSGLDASAIKTLTGKKRSYEPSGNGSPELAKALAAVPLTALHSSSLTDRSEVLVPLTRVLKHATGTPVSVRRTDSSPQDIIVAVRGLSPDGLQIEEEVLLERAGADRTDQCFLVVNDVTCPVGSVSIARRYELGFTDDRGFSPTTDDLPAALAELLMAVPVVNRLKNITSGAVSGTDEIEVKGAAWAMTDLPPGRSSIGSRSTVNMAQPRRSTRSPTPKS